MTMQKKVVAVLGKNERVTIGLYIRSDDAAPEEPFLLSESRDGGSVINGRAEIHVPLEWQPLTDGAVWAWVQRAVLPR